MTDRSAEVKLFTAHIHLKILEMKRSIRHLLFHQQLTSFRRTLLVLFSLRMYGKDLIFQFLQQKSIFFGNMLLVEICFIMHTDRNDSGFSAIGLQVGNL